MKSAPGWSAIALLLAAASGCDSEVIGGGGGAGGAGGGGASEPAGQGGATGETTVQVSSSSAGGSGQGGSGQGGSGEGGSGQGGADALGACEAHGGTGATSTGTFTCSSDYTCEGGEVNVECTDDGTLETCVCSLDGSVRGECVNPDSTGCSMPVNCCHALLGGQAEPNAGPYGACESDGGSSAQSGGGETACGASYTCDGGGLWIDCSGTDAGATCTCRDDQGFLLATCEQPTVECGYETGCCHDLVN
jgi:hypothetical protein